MPHLKISIDDKTMSSILSFIMAVGAMGTFAMLTWALTFRVVPQENRELLSVVIGFLAGNMVGPVYRKLYGGPDAGTAAVQDKTATALQSSIDKLPPAPPTPPTETKP